MARSHVRLKHKRVRHVSYRLDILAKFAFGAFLLMLSWGGRHKQARYRTGCVGECRVLARCRGEVRVWRFPCLADVGSFAEGARHAIISVDLRTGVQLAFRGTGSEGSVHNQNGRGLHSFDMLGIQYARCA